MKIQVKLHDGTLITADVENYNAMDLNELLNNQQLMTVVIGDVIVNKNTIQLISPIVVE